MKILVIGSGAREHSIAEAFRRSLYQPYVIVSPGNPGIAREFETVELESFEDIEDYCIIESVDLVFIGPEKPLSEGLADHLRAHNIHVVGPSKSATRIESSKFFAKQLMMQNNIPTARFESYTDFDDAVSSLEKWNHPIVIKADGLAAGKGVFISNTKDDSVRVISDLLQKGSLGESGNRILIEEYLSGWETSLFAITDGVNFKTTIFSQDHKQLFDGDQGPNTGGMGAYAPVPEAEIYRHDIENLIVGPTIKAMGESGCPFQGILYIGLMITASGPKVIEFNCRLGDPECQTILPLLETDFVDICNSIIGGTVADLDLKWMNKSAVCVYAVSRDYPKNSNFITPITFSAHMDSFAFYGAVHFQNNELLAGGGRIMAITSVGLSKNEARNKVYHDLNKVFFEGMHYRRDIGLRENKF